MRDFLEIRAHVLIKEDFFLKWNLMEIMTYLRQSRCPPQGQTWRTSQHSVAPVSQK